MGRCLFDRQPLCCSARARSTDHGSLSSSNRTTPHATAPASAWRLPQELTPVSDPTPARPARASTAGLPPGRGVANLGWMTQGTKPVRRRSQPADPAPALTPADADQDHDRTTPQPRSAAHSPDLGSDDKRDNDDNDDQSPLVALTQPIAIERGQAPFSDMDGISQSLEAETRFLRNLVSHLRNAPATSRFLTVSTLTHAPCSQGWEGAAVPEEDDGGLTTDEIAAFKQTADSTVPVAGPKMGGEGSYALDPLAGLTTAVLVEADDDDDSDESDDDVEL